MDNRTLRLLNKTVAGKKLCIVSHIKRGQIVDRCTKSGLKGIPNLHNGGDRLTNYSSTNSRLTITRYLFRANIVDLQPMGDGLTK